jgi:plasmid replication initiation protein
MTGHGQQFDLDLDFDVVLNSPLCGTAKNERTLMIFNFFALTKDRQTELPAVDDGKYRIEVMGTSEGVATIWDKELLIYVASLLKERANRGEEVTRVIQFTAHDYFRLTGTKPSGSAYERLVEGLGRLKSTTIRTNLLDEDGEGGEQETFSWLDSVRIKWRKDRNGEKMMQAVRVELSDRLFNTLQKSNKILTYDPRYFGLKPIEKRLYEIARAYCGNQQRGFKMNIEKLRLRVGIQSDLRYFKAELAKISGNMHALPDYGVMLVDPRLKRSLDKNQPRQPGRTPLKSFLVFFFRTDRMSRMPLVADAPLIDDDGDFVDHPL